MINNHKIFFEPVEKSAKNGFIALMSAIIISAVLLMISVSLVTTGYFSRYNVLDNEFKNRSSGLAEACIDKALLRLAQNPTDTTTGPVGVGTDSCTVQTVTLDFPTTGQITIQSKGIFQQAVTNIQVVVNSTNLTLITWEELPSL